MLYGECTLCGSPRDFGLNCLKGLAVGWNVLLLHLQFFLSSAPGKMKCEERPMPMAEISKRSVLQHCPWEADRFFVPPRGDDKWQFTSDAKWVFKCHSKSRKRPFHPLHRTFPLQDVACLTGERVTIMFPDFKSSSQERLIFCDQFTDTSSPFPKDKPECSWKGFTFFKIQQRTETEPCALLEEKVKCNEAIELNEAATQPVPDDDIPSDFEVVV